MLIEEMNTCVVEALKLRERDTIILHNRAMDESEDDGRRTAYLRTVRPNGCGMELAVAFDIREAEEMGCHDFREELRRRLALEAQSAIKWLSSLGPDAKHEVIQ